MAWLEPYSFVRAPWTWTWHGWVGDEDEITEIMRSLLDMSESESGVDSFSANRAIGNIAVRYSTTARVDVCLLTVTVTNKTSLSLHTVMATVIQTQPIHTRELLTTIYNVI